MPEEIDIVLLSSTFQAGESIIDVKSSSKMSQSHGYGIVVVLVVDVVVVVLLVVLVVDVVVEVVDVL